MKYLKKNQMKYFKINPNENTLKRITADSKSIP